MLLALDTATSTASLLLNGEAPVVQDSTTWPFDHTVEPGLYTMKVDAQPPYNSIAGKPIKVDPPQCSTTVRVQP